METLFHTAGYWCGMRAKNQIFEKGTQFPNNTHNFDAEQISLHKQNLGMLIQTGPLPWKKCTDSLNSACDYMIGGINLCKPMEASCGIEKVGRSNTMYMKLQLHNDYRTTLLHAELNQERCMQQYQKAWQWG